MTVDIRIIDELQMSPEMDRAIRAGLCECFPADVATFSHTRAWHGSAPEFSLVIADDRHVVAHLGVVHRRVAVGAEHIDVAGIQNVFVRPQFRGHGLVDEILRESMAESLRRRIDLGMLFCLPILEQIYARNGWRTIAHREIWATNARGRRYLLGDKNILMIHPLLRGELPEGEIDLCGDDW